MARLSCPGSTALAAAAQMLPPTAAQGLIATARSTGQRVQVVSLPSGHNQMSEAPDETLMALRDFLATA